MLGVPRLAHLFAIVALGVMPFHALAQNVSPTEPFEERDTYYPNTEALAKEVRDDDVVLTLDVLKGANLKTPRFTTPGPVTRQAQGLYADLVSGKLGVHGDPTKATREKGEIIVTRVVNHVSALIGEIMQQYPVGVRPQTA